MTKRVNPNDRLLIRAQDWNNTLEVNDIVLNAGKRPALSFTQKPYTAIEAVCADPVEQGDCVLLGETDLTLTPDPSDQLFYRPVITCSAFPDPPSNATPWILNWGIATKAAEADDICPIAIAGIVLAKCTASRWAYPNGTGELTGSYSGSCYVLQSIGGGYCLVQLALRQNVWQFVKPASGTDISFYDAEGTTVAGVLSTAELMDPHNIYTAMAAGGKGTVLQIGNGVMGTKFLYVIQGDCP